MGTRDRANTRVVDDRPVKLLSHEPILFIAAARLADPDKLKGYEGGAIDTVPVPVMPEILRAKLCVFAGL